MRTNSFLFGTSAKSLKNNLFNKVLMSLIDENGNILRKINLIDLLIIIILFMIFASTVYLFNSYDELSALDNSSSLKIPKLRLLLETKVPEEHLKFIKKGEKDLSGKINAVVEEVIVTNSTSSLKKVLITLLVKTPISNDLYYFYYSNKQPILIEKPLKVRLRFIELNTVIKDISLVEE